MLANPITHIGIDEAGLGPALGPMCMAAVAISLPTHVDAWDLLQASISRKPISKDTRICIADSKVVHRLRGLQGLEAAALAATSLTHSRPPAQYQRDDFLDLLGLDASRLTQLWYANPKNLLPLKTPHAQLESQYALCADDFKTNGVSFSVAQARLLTASELNRYFDEDLNKAEVTQLLLADLLRAVLRASDSETFEIVIDRQGGRIYYAPFLSTVFFGAWVDTISESAQASKYSLQYEGKRLTVTFRPKADATSLPVAWASLIAKYLREILMLEFNGYFCARVPELKPTAGYHGDAPRFMEAITGVLTKHSIARNQVWRNR